MKTPPTNATVASPTKWTWRGDLRNCLGAARETKDPVKLEEMVKDILSGRVLDDGEISEELMLNQQVPFPAAEKLARRFGGDFAYELCSRKDATPAVLDECYDHYDTLIVNTVAAHQNTSQDTLLRMSQCKNLPIAIAAIKSGRLPESVLEEFAGSDEVWARESVAKVSKNPAILRKLAADSNAAVRSEAVKNQHTDIDVVEKMARETDCLAAKTAAAGRSTNPELISRLFDDLEKNYDAGLADALKQNENAPTHLRVAAALKRPDGE